MSMVKCRMRDIILERENEFRLSVSELYLSTQGHNPVNKLPLIGKSGAGKSTLLNLMAAIEWPCKGTISWSFPDNTEIEWTQYGSSAYEARMLRRKYFGFAFQDSTLIPHLRVCDNLSYPLLFKGYSTKESYETALNTLNRVLLEDEKKYSDDLFRRFPSKLSGGQRQRVALVQAIIHEPYVLFADEPTGSLDSSTRKQVMKMLYNWVDDPEYKGKRLLVWVTHHDNDPDDAGASWNLFIESGSYQWRRVESTKEKGENLHESLD